MIQRIPTMMAAGCVSVLGGQAAVLGLSFFSFEIGSGWLDSGFLFALFLSGALIMALGMAYEGLLDMEPKIVS